MTVTLTSSGACVLKVGDDINTDLTAGTTVGGFTSDAAWTQFINQAESIICAETRHNWIDDYSTLNVDVRYILDQVCSDLAAMYGVQYDMSSLKAETKLNVLRDRAEKGLNILKDKKSEDFIKGA